MDRYFVGTNSYKTIAISRTNFDGVATAYLTLYTDWYRFILIQDGEIVEQFTPTTITETDITFRIGAAGQGEWFQYVNQVGFSCSTSNVTNSTSCTVTDTSGLMNTVSLSATRYTPLGWIDVCNDTSTSASVTLVCDLGDTDGELYYYVLGAMFDETSYVLEAEHIDYRSTDPIYGTLGVLVGLFIIIQLAMIGAFKGPVPAMGMTAIGVALTWGFGLVAMEYGAVMSFFIVVGLAIYKMRSGGGSSA